MCRLNGFYHWYGPWASWCVFHTVAHPPQNVAFSCLIVCNFSARFYPYPSTGAMAQCNKHLFIAQPGLYRVAKGSGKMIWADYATEYVFALISNIHAGSKTTTICPPNLNLNPKPLQHRTPPNSRQYDESYVDSTHRYSAIYIWC